MGYRSSGRTVARWPGQSWDFGVHAESLGLYPAIGELEDQWPVFFVKYRRSLARSATNISEMASKKAIRIGPRKRIDSTAISGGKANQSKRV